MKPDISGKRLIFLHPGEVIYSRNPIVVSTVLGSCLSVIMYSPEKKFGGISHCQLPDCKSGRGCCYSCSDPYKFTSCTFHKMIEKFEINGIDKKYIDVKIFGAADVLYATEGNRLDSIGRQNIKSAEEQIKSHNLKLVTSDVGGKTGRRIYFLPNTGEIFLTRLKNNEKN